ncbi:MAG: sigma-70 family RNA polymerase sigma factor, partial [bacterium]|nr:sigma-70 family RNA polymerase sigma factor [bacterium]
NISLSAEKVEVCDLASAEDARLIEQVLAGNVTAYRQLVEKYQRKAHSVAYGVLGNFEDAEDVVQEAFIKAYRGLSSFRGTASFYTWLYRIVYNLAIDLSRKRYRRTESFVGESSTLESFAEAADKHPRRGVLSAPMENPEDYCEQYEIGERVKTAISTLTPAHRTVILLREVDGLSYEEISRVMKCSKGTVMSRLFHARKKLQSELRDYLLGKE